ncbi:GNAT family N-acetyltransferase [Sporomusa sp.]|uniref:GNAT family N-acetyltransferase n=1 Tax=Sporomusa sp. TaxID=2078658 RepID=UPI002CDCC9F7|nr:GNAT family N-acetyltransferase [Sporomusa sp.]HWR06274.1 GNAT family N-acetyltransferase [Sporomusa sp.]
MENIIFDEIKEEHLTAVWEIYTHYVLNTNATFHAHALARDEMRELLFFDNPKYKTFIIRSGETISGYVILTQHKKREAYDETAEVTVYLRPDYIGRGIGSQAVKFIEKIAKQQNIHVLIATICGENFKSINLFERNDFAKCAHYKEVGKKFGQLLDVVAYQKIIT